MSVVMRHSFSFDDLNVARLCDGGSLEFHGVAV